jgi:hypothetical protein
MSENQSLACDLTAIPASVREEHVLTAPQLFRLAQEVQELPDGFAIRFLQAPGRFMQMATFVENERLCCPFFNFALDVEPNNGSLWLRLTGQEGVKELLRTTFFGDEEDKTALKQLIHTGHDPHLEELVAQTTLPVLNGVFKQTPSS